MRGNLKSAEIGTLANGHPARAYTLSLASGVSATVSDFGASLIGMQVPDRGGQLDDVVLGCDHAACLERQSAYLGAAIGRVSGRIGDARFNLDGREYRLTANSGMHHLHGGATGLGRRCWSAEVVDGEWPAIRFAINSDHGDEGYPGALQATLVYRLEPPARLVLTFSAVASHATPFSPTCHAYFNLDGHAAGSCVDHRLRLNASRYTPIGEDLIPAGAIERVAGTPFDFVTEKAISRDLGHLPRGYDHNFVIDGGADGIRDAATLRSVASGRTLTVLTDRPCIHLYTAGGMDIAHGKHGARYGPCSGIALETQGFPDALNHPRFTPDILRPGMEFRSRTIFQFDQETDT